MVAKRLKVDIKLKTVAQDFGLWTLRGVARGTWFST